VWGEEWDREVAKELIAREIKQSLFANAPQIHGSLTPIEEGGGEHPKGEIRETPFEHPIWRTSYKADRRCQRGAERFFFIF
jgi:hypothetical protein